MSLKLRLNLLITALLALVMLAGVSFMIQSAREDVRAEIQSTLNLALHFLDAELSYASAAAVSGRLPDLQFNLKTLGQIRHLKIEFYDTRGSLLDTNQTPDGSRPRTAPAWFARMVSFVSPSWGDIKRVVTADGEILGELIVRPDPSYEVEEIWKDTSGLLKLAVILFLMVNAMVYWVVGRSLRPLDRILEALTQLEQGNLATRLPQFALPELSRIGGGFNRMVETMEQSVTQNHRLTQQLIRLQEEERRSLARELHDELGQCLTAIHADAVTILNSDRGRHLPIRDSAQAIVDVTRQMMGMVRDLLQRLRPGSLDDLGLEEALHELVAVWRQRNSWASCRFTLSGEFGDLDDTIKIAVYRVLQESLTNITRHAAATCVDISICLYGKERQSPLGQFPGTGSNNTGVLEILVKDNGSGIAAEKQNAGFGLAGMRERVRMQGGVLSMESRAGRGVTICARLPVPMKETAEKR